MPYSGQVVEPSVKRLAVPPGSPTKRMTATNQQRSGRSAGARINRSHMEVLAGLDPRLHLLVFQVGWLSRFVGGVGRHWTP